MNGKALAHQALEPAQEPRPQGLPGAARRRQVLLACLVIGLLFFCAAAWASQEDAPSTRAGYYETDINLYEAPSRHSAVLKRIRQYTPLEVRVDGDYAQKGYGLAVVDGVEGYLNLGTLLAMPQEMADARAGRTMFARDERVLREQSLHNAAVLSVLPPETPFVVLSRTKFMLKVDVLGQAGYLYAGELEELLPDTEQLPELVYSAAEQPLLSLPLKGAAVLAQLTAGQLLTVTGQNRGYLRVQSMGLAGYLPQENTGRIGAVAEETMLVYAQAAEPLYTQVGEEHLSGQAMEPGRLYEVSAQAGDYVRLRESGLFVRAQAVQAILLRAFEEPRLAHVAGRQSLAALPREDAQSASALEPGRLYTFTAASGSWWYVDDGLVQGFVPSRQLVQLPKSGEAMNRTYAVYTGEASFLPGASQPQAIRPGELVELWQRWGAQWFRTRQGAYVFSDAVRIIGSDAPVTPHPVRLEAPQKLLSLPDEALGEVVAELTAGETLTVLGFSRYFLLVRAGEKEGYVVGKALKTEETRYLPDADPPKYGILVNKADYSVSIYKLDEQGQRSGEPVRREIAALGKRSTPTPSGKHVLGFKQRWVRFPHTVAPHSVTYLRGRYLHGIPCYKMDVATITEWGRPELGTASTGGCVRMEFDLAAFIYFNCPSYTTIMEVVNGLE